jgi:erythronate-4-phosphate dehydrogenase
VVVDRETSETDTRACCKVTLHILADENIPAVEYFFAVDTHVQRLGGRAIGCAEWQNIDILLIRSVTRVDAALLSGTAVKFVGTATSGLDHIDQEYLSQRGIGFAYAPGSNANSVVEYVLAAVASIGETLEKLLAGGVVGIVGYGHIGKAVAARFDALGIRYRVFDPWLQQNMINQAATLEQVLAKSSPTRQG